MKFYLYLRLLMMTNAISLGIALCSQFPVGAQKVILPLPGRGRKLSRAWGGGGGWGDGEEDCGGDGEEDEVGRVLFNSRTCKLPTSMKQRISPRNINS